MVSYNGLTMPQMSRKLVFLFCFLTGALDIALAIDPPTGVVTRSGDQSLVLHWDRSSDSTLAGYRVYRSLTNGPFALLTPSLLTSPGFCDLDSKVVNGQTNSYYVTGVAGATQESAPSSIVSVAPHAFTNDDDFLEYLQQTSFDYFWYLANPNNGMVPDRSATGSAASIAAVGFGLTAIGIGIDHGWITRSQGAARVAATLNTFLQQPQGTNAAGVIGYKGWFYHFLDMNTALRSGAELSSIDTALLLAGILYSKQYFDGTDANESIFATTADAIFNRVDWNWMARGSNAVSMGWFPPNSFLDNNWIGYNEGMLLYCLGLGAATNPLPDTFLECVDQWLYVGHKLWFCVRPVSTAVWASILPLLD